MIAGAKVRGVFVEGLTEAFFAEKLISRTFRNAPRGIASAELKILAENLLSLTKEHIERLLRIFEEIEWPDAIDHPAGGGAYDQIVEIAEAARRGADAGPDPYVRDAAFLSAARAFARWKIGRYRLLGQWALELGLIYAAQLLQSALEDETRMATLLGREPDPVADGYVVRRAAA